MFKTEIDINRKDFLLANVYYLKKYIGLKEYIMLAVLLAAGIFLYITDIQVAFFPSEFVIIMFGVFAAVISGLLCLFLALANKGYTLEFENRNATKWQIDFFDNDFTATQFEGDKEFKETYKYSQIEKLLIKKAVIYVYGGTSTMFYIKTDSFIQGNFIEFAAFIKTKMNPLQLNMKMKRSKYLKKRKNNLE